MQQNSSNRGRPKISVDWPQDKFTFKNLLSSERGKLCASSLRNKIKSATDNGNIMVVDKVKNLTGRPELVYQASAGTRCASYSSYSNQTSEQASDQSMTQCRSEESTGESTLLS